MPITIGNNIAALRGQRQLAETARALGTTSERLSSGLRINRASDDAAGLAVSSALKSDVRIHTQAIRNLNDGVSALTIADATIDSMTTIVTRIRELAQQSANGAISQKQRLAIEKEASALSNEYLRLMQTTAFNGQKLLDGSLTNGLRLQGGVGVQGSIQSDLGGKMGNGAFGTPANTAPAPRPSLAVATGDFNRDGKLDVAAAVFDGAMIGIHLGNGGGSFTSAADVSSIAEAHSLSTGDFNGDGILDLAVASASESEIRVALGNGSGGFTAQNIISVDSAADIDVGDFNGDGRSDLLTISRNNNEAYVFFAQTNGTFATTPSITLSKNDPLQAAAGDFNNDGLSDLAIAGGSERDIEVFLNQAGSGFSSSASIQPLNSIDASGSFDLDLADLNRDGALDFVFTQSDGNIDSALGRGNGTFSTITNTQATGINAFSALGDINGDGFDDLAISDSVSLEVRLFLGMGNGGFSETTGVNRSGFDPKGVALGDFNGDGVLDLVNSDEAQFVLQSSLGQTKDGVAPLLPFSLKSRADALQAIPILDRKIQQLAAQRGVIGAFESRLSSALRTIYSRTDNAAAAASRIVDADIASESASLSRLNILREAGSAVLAQANQQPALALTLLKNR